MLRWFDIAVTTFLVGALVLTFYAVVTGNA